MGNITSIYDGSKTTTYKYDALNQLVRADNPYENKTHIYTYENGNITEDKVYQYTVGTSEPSDLKYTVKYSYSNEKWADVLTGVEKVYPQNSVNTISLEQEETPEIVTRLLGENAQRYDMKSRLLPNSGISVGGNYSKVESDEIGNITKYNDSIYTWIGRQLQSVSNEDYTSTFSYNSDGQRIGKTIVFKGASTYNYEYYYNGDILAGYKLVITKSDGSSTTHNVAFMYDENGEAFGFNYNGNDYYYVRNAQNDVIFISNSDNTGVVMYQYDAWGNMTACYDTSDDGMLSIVNPYTYRGYFYEFETNTYFLKSRYYNPELCRFISADSVVSGTGGEILGYNMFAYCLNNPINRSDNNGNWSTRKIIKGGFKAAKNVIKYAYKCILQKKKISFTDALAEAAIGFADNYIPGTETGVKAGRALKPNTKPLKAKAAYSKDVVNANYCKSKGKSFNATSFDEDIFKSNEIYRSYCLNKTTMLEQHTSITLGFSIANKSWDDLSEDEQSGIINTVGSWDPRMSLKIGIYYGWEAALDLIF